MSAAIPPPERMLDWLLGTRQKAPPVVAGQLTIGLFASFPIFLGGVVNTTAVAAIAAWRHETFPFLFWLGFEIALGCLRLGVFAVGRRRIAADLNPPRHLAAVLSCIWAGSVGVGTFLCLTSSDWVLGTIACLSAAAMVCGMCLRNFGTPRLVAVMVLAALLPCAYAGLVTDEPVMAMISIQLPVYILTILSAAFGLHRMLHSWIDALHDLESTQSLNETILQSSPDYMLILNEQHDIVFSKRPGQDSSDDDPLMGHHWLSLLPADSLAEAQSLLAAAASGTPTNIVTYQRDSSGVARWFDNRVNQMTDNSGRLIIVSRDITHQKQSEERAIWMANHDALTGLPNRSLLQDRLDSLLLRPAHAACAMMILDVDHFKTINDTLGHDAGDALLCAIAERLSAAVGEGDLVARTGGDEFALLITARTNAEVQTVADRILESLREPVRHADRLIECGASLGASLIPRDGHSRSEIMKAADIALYAAKLGGRGQLRTFEPAMMLEVEKHQAMLSAARHALQADAIVPYYQPKVSLRTSEIIGFEALLRWIDDDGRVRGPDTIHAAFEDPALSTQLSDRMFGKVIHDIARWIAAGVAFGHVAVNVTDADLRREDFAQSILALLDASRVPPACLQIEVTENVFLGQGADAVELSLQRLSEQGIRIALDDFGTGYASLSHLNHYPVDLLKIDRTFVDRIGRSADVEAISSAVINLGHCLGLEVVAEGIETEAQERHLRQLGCDFGQGFLYSPALSASAAMACLIDGPLAQQRA